MGHEKRTRKQYQLSHPSSYPILLPEHLQIIPRRKQPPHLVQPGEKPSCIHKNRAEHKTPNNQEWNDAAEDLGPAAYQAQDPG